MTDTTMLEFARRGATERMAAIQAERETILAAFPDLADGTTIAAGEIPIVNAPSAKRRRRVVWSAAQRKAIGRRMKRYWHERRQAIAARQAAATRRP